MFESIFKLTPREFKKKHIMAVDIATAAVSAVLAVRHENTEINEISKTLRHPINLLGGNLGGRRASHIVRDGVLKIFKDAHAISRHLDNVFIVLSDPFFSDITFSKKIYRQNPAVKITAAEISALLGELKKTSAPSSLKSDLVLVAEEVLSDQVNGYEVLSAEGYKGKSLEISAVFTFINPFMKEAVENAKEKFFPRAHIVYISDPRLMRRTLKKLRALDAPALLFDIDGEATGIYFLSGTSIEHLGISAFGVKTLERRISPLSLYASDMLEENMKAKMESALKASLADWWGALAPHMKKLEEMGGLPPPKKCFIAGRDPASSIFLTPLSGYLRSFFGFEVDLKPFSVEPLRDYFHPASLISQKQDILLASLLY